MLVAGVCLSAFLLASVLPSLHAKTYASPDETVAAITAEQLTVHHQACIQESLATSFSWLHPRSWVSQGDRMVPVIFLGWPWLLSGIERIFGAGILPWIGGWILLSSLIPLFFLLRRFGWGAAMLGVCMTLTVPWFLLYTNRGLFSNVPSLAFFLWSLWLFAYLSRDTSNPSVSSRGEWSMDFLHRWAGRFTFFQIQNRLFFSFLFGLILACTIVVRPVEVLWMLPWFVLVGWKWRPTWKELLLVLFGLACICVPVASLTAQTYGAWYRVGYLLHDNPLPVFVSGTNQLAVTQVQTVPPIAPTLFHWHLPFGFHLDSIALNLRQFALGLALPWTMILLGACVAFPFFIYVTTRHRGYMASAGLCAYWLAGVWTVGALLYVYGSGHYTDNINPTALTIGNSFLRYLLPVAPLIGACVAWVYSLARTRERVALIVVCILLSGFGVYRAYVADNEGIWTTRGELAQYDLIRAGLQTQQPKPDVVLSERSDKIFFPETRVASPVPPLSEVVRLLRTTSLVVDFFSPALSQAARDHWRTSGLQLEDVAVFRREHLFHVTLLPL